MPSVSADEALVGGRQPPARATHDAEHGTAEVSLQIFTDLAAAEPQWREFEQTASYTVFQTFDWLNEWHRHIGAMKQLTPVITLVFIDEQPCLLLPLAIERVAGVRRLVWLGVDLADYNAPLFAANFRDHIPPGQFAATWERIISLLERQLQFDVVELDRMPAVIGAQSNPFVDLPIWTAEYSAHAATIGDSWDRFYESRASTTTRQTDRRKLRRLSDHGKVRFVEAQEPHDIERTVAALIEQKRASYPAFGYPCYLAFYQAVAANPHLRSIVHVTRVVVGDDPAATGLGLRFKGRYHLILHSYLDKYAKYSPGRHHIHHLIQSAISQQMEVFDFTIGDEEYKKHWSDHELPLLRYYESRTIRGQAVVAFRLMRHHAVRMYRFSKRLMAAS
jgi:CelD/BcsL family acetyltransferase involved in cellulose biosynthesis